LVGPTGFTASGGRLINAVFTRAAENGRGWLLGVRGDTHRRAFHSSRHPRQAPTGSVKPTGGGRRKRPGGFLGRCLPPIGIRPASLFSRRGGCGGRWGGQKEPIAGPGAHYQKGKPGCEPFGACKNFGPIFRGMGGRGHPYIEKQFAPTAHIRAGRFGRPRGVKTFFPGGMDLVLHSSRETVAAHHSGPAKTMAGTGRPIFFFRGGATLGARRPRQFVFSIIQVSRGERSPGPAGKTA